MTEPARVSVDRIKAEVAAEFNLSVRELVGPRREREIVRPRQLAIALALRLTPNSSVVVGRLFGGRDHSTVLESRRRIAALRSGDLRFDRRCRRVEERLVARFDLPVEIQLSFLIGPLFDFAAPRPTACGQPGLAR